VGHLPRAARPGAEWYVGAARHLTRAYPWDLLAVQLHIQDGINHIIARDICPEDPTYSPAKEAVAWEQIEAAYVTSDRLVGELIEACADDETVVCVVSDHGALPTFRQCLVSGALARAADDLPQGRGERPLAGRLVPDEGLPAPRTRLGQPEGARSAGDR
jgi:hypothetical protein